VIRTASRRPPLPLALAALALLAAPPGRAEERISRAGVSRNGRFAVRLVEEAKDRCRVEVLKDGSAAHWQLPRCVGTADDLFFVSDDGERFWVLKTFPEKSVSHAKRGGDRGWTSTVVAVLYDRRGSAVREVRLNEVVRTQVGLDNVRQFKKRFQWLGGVSGVPGNPPRLNAAGQVEFDTVEPRTHQFAF
jgi:hypothetical protein